MGKLTLSELGEISSAVDVQATGLAVTLTASQWARGSQWYPGAHGVAVALAAESSVSVAAAAGVIAALSPQLSWEWNQEDARNCLVDGARYSGFRALGRSVLKANAIADGADADGVLGGRKVRSFWHCIEAPTLSLDVVIDLWFLRHVIPSHYFDGYARRVNFLARKGVYDAVADGTRSAAARFNVLPSTLQAALWIQAREAAGKV